MELHSAPLADVLSVTTGRLLSHNHIDGVYNILRTMTGQDLYTHQLPDVADVVKPELIAQHPFLASLQPPAGADLPDLMAWLTEAERVHGQEIPVRPIVNWQHRDPIEDAADKVGAHKVWVV